MKSTSQMTPAQRGARRFVLTAALAVASAGSLLAAGTVGLKSAQAQASAPDQRGMPDRGGCDHHGGRGGHDEHGALMGPFGEGRMLDRMLDDVKATDAQRTKIKQIAEAAKKDLQAQHEAGRSLHEKTMQILSAPKIDDAAAESLRQQMLAMHDKVSKRSLQAMLDISRVLTPEQRAQLAQRMKDRPARGGKDGDKGPNQ